MELRRAASIIAHWWWLLVLGTAIGGAAAWGTSQLLVPKYSATTTIFVNQSAAPGTITYSDALLNQQLVQTYARMATQPVVLDEVHDRVELPFDASKLEGMVSAQPVPQTQLLEIVAEGPDAEQARDIANGVAEIFIEQQRPLLPPGQPANVMRVAQPAILPDAPVSPRKLLNTVVGSVLGLFVTLGVVGLREHLDDTVKAPENLDAAASLPSLGMISRMSGRDGPADHFLAPDYLRGPVAESYRILRTNLDFSAVDKRLGTLLITSANPREGKTTTAANLAVVLGQFGRRVIY